MAVLRSTVSGSNVQNHQRATERNTLRITDANTAWRMVLIDQMAT